MIDLVIADDHPVVRAGLRAVVESTGDLRVVHEVATAEELLAWLADGGTADVVLLDLRFGPDRLTGAEATRTVVDRYAVPVLVVTTYGSDAEILSAVEAGATGYLLKDAPTEELAGAVRAAAAGRTVLDPAVQRRLLGRVRQPFEALSSRELEVLALVAAGRSNEAVARELVVSVATVKTHLTHVNTKLGTRSRTEAVAVARERGLLP
ncbi:MULTISPECIES: response regulator [unclassified Isoptericola]|uniref:response regulator transcription factor n=1 Tax=unclassified Isoptericola TaxID=2623355 RepID=UPI002713C9CA|nr:MULTISPECIES: response regulator transcription factor [unclassified Isoptericola]MDO8145874.1 response regulator transcription factor [Isoptericola sp. 178]MDO8147799.1 response regulator transcription factor [Isoptericola sp. b515]MDO8149942.1 response regulator transcription factor [Isoptericola sp. b408]